VGPQLELALGCVANMCDSPVHVVMAIGPGSGGVLGIPSSSHRKLRGGWDDPAIDRIVPPFRDR